MTLRARLFALLLVLAVGAANGQTLARKGWAGSGITVEPWWEGAVLYQIDPLTFQDSKDDGFGDLKGVIQRLDYLQGLHVDAIVLSPFQLQLEFGRTAGVPAFDPKYGSEEDLDQLVQEAARRKMRLFVDVPMDASHSTQQNLDEARFWLSRGIAGLRLTGDARETALPQAQLADRLRQLQKLCATYAGQRVLLWDLPETMPVAASAPRQHHATATASPLPNAQMTVNRRLLAMNTFTANELRVALAAPAGASTQVPVSDTGNHARSFDRFGDSGNEVKIAKLLATGLLLGGGAPMLYFGQEIGMATTPAPGDGAKTVDPTPMQWGSDPAFSRADSWMNMGRNAASANVALEDNDADSLLNWYRRLSALHHESIALHSGTIQLIAETNPDIVAWVRTPAANGVPVVVVCNLTNRVLRVSVAAEVRRLGIEPGPGMMHTLTSTGLTASSASLGVAKEPVSGPVSMNGIELEPFGVYVGEVPRPLGLESMPSTPRRTSR
jgi:hypothetical protein